MPARLVPGTELILPAGPVRRHGRKGQERLAPAFSLDSRGAAALPPNDASPGPTAARPGGRSTGSPAALEPSRPSWRRTTGEAGSRPVRRYDAPVTDSENWDAAVDQVPEIPPPPRLTRTEQATWVVYGVVAILLLVIPIATHSFSLPDVAAWVLWGGAVTMTAIWMRTGALRGPEWLKPDDYDQFLKEIQRIPGSDQDQTVPPTPPAPLAGPGPSGDPLPPP